MYSRLWWNASVCGTARSEILPRRWRVYVAPYILLIFIILLINAATFSTMVGGVISDIYHAEDRNTPMALFSGAALFGTGLAPLLCSVIVYHTTWRWIYYSHAIVSAVFVVIIFFFFKETRGSVILSRKAQALNKYYEALEDAGHFGVIMADESGEKQLTKRIRWKVKSDEQRASLGQMISISLYRPFRMFCPGNHPRILKADYCQTCFSLNRWFSSSPFGRLSAGPCCISSSAPSH